MRRYLCVLCLLYGLACPMRSLAMYPVEGQDVAQPAPEIQSLLEKGHEAERQSRRGTAAERLARSEEARHAYEQALKLAQDRQDRAGSAAAYASMGHVYLFSEASRALTYYAKAVPIYKEIGDESGWALAVLMTGRAYTNAGEMAGAIREYLECLPVLEKRGDKRLLELVHTGLGESYLDRHETEKAVAELEKARAFARENGDSEAETLILGNMGIAFSYQGQERRAIEMKTQALALLEPTENKPAIAACLEGLSVDYLSVGDYLKSLECGDRALKLEEEIGTKSSLALALDILASDYDAFGQKDRALDLRDQALRAGMQGDDLKTRAQIFANTGVAYCDLRRFDQARQYAEQARDLYTKLEDDNSLAFSLFLLSRIECETGDLLQAKALAENARRDFAKTDDREGMATALQQSGVVAEKRRLPVEALARYREALTLFQEIGDTRGEANALTHIGALEESLGNLSQAEGFYEQALMKQETLRAGLGSLAAAKSRYHEEQLPLYQCYTHLLLRNKHEARAFEWAQKAKARTLVDLMESANPGDPPTMTPEEKQQAESLRRRDKEVSRQWLSSIGDPDDPKRQVKPDASRRQTVDARTREIRAEQQRLEADWRTFQEQLTLHNPHADRSSVPTATLAAAAALLPEDTALLEYAVVKQGLAGAGQDEIVLFALTRQGDRPRLEAFTVKTPLAELARKARAFREACAARPDSSSARPYQQMARDLYGVLVAPAEASLRGKRRLIFCPDGPVWDVPFQALLVPPSGPAGRGASEFLWERYSVCYAYSATELKAAMDVRRRPNRPKPEQGMLVLANPDYGQADPIFMAGGRRAGAPPNRESLRGLYSRAGGFRSLPFTRFEAKAILASFPNAAIKMGGQAQEDVVKQTGGNYRFLHIAAHAVFNDTAPMFSGIVLARPPKDSPDDGILTAREIRDLNLGADLLVLSACDTARGVNTRGEGLVGLTWAAFVAGVPAQVVSQWSVDDAATAQLMGGFYEGLKQGKPKDAALRGAALALLRDGRRRHPFYWAPFLLMGDWR